MKFSSSQMDKVNVDHKVVIFVYFDHFSGAAPPPHPALAMMIFLSRLVNNHPSLVIYLKFIYGLNRTMSKYL